MVLTRCCVVSAALVAFACDDSNDPVTTGRTSAADRDANVTSSAEASSANDSSNIEAGGPAPDVDSPMTSAGSAAGSAAGAGPDADVPTAVPEFDDAGRSPVPAASESSSNSGENPELEASQGAQPPQSQPTASEHSATGAGGAGPLTCPENCPRLPVCVACDDGGCAEQSFACSDDGSCGTVTWLCESGEAPEDVPEIAPPAADPEHPCAGLSCGDACNSCPAGMLCLVGPGWCDRSDACVQITPDCTEPAPPNDEQPCSVATDCPSEPCVTCEQGAEWCPTPLCHENVCTLSPNLCPERYQPCADKEDGDACLLCSPLDPDCEEPDTSRECKSGVCQRGH